MLNKVPEVTIYFWLIKVLCTTVGETFADNLNEKLKLGLTNTTYLMGTLLVVSLVFQFRARKYVPGLYWLSVVLISVVGTLITDNLTDNLGVSLVTTTVVFSIVLALVFAGWYASEKILSIHSIYTARREAWYWLTILFTFALGTAAGDLTAERINVGYWKSGMLFAGLSTGTAATLLREVAGDADGWLAEALPEAGTDVDVLGVAPPPLQPAMIGSSRKAIDTAPSVKRLRLPVMVMS
jgi:uncharacterized membrane-anchored protein